MINNMKKLQIPTNTSQNIFRKAKSQNITENEQSTINNKKNSILISTSAGINTSKNISNKSLLKTSAIISESENKKVSLKSNNILLFIIP